MSETKSSGTRTYAPTEVRDLMASYIAGSQQDFTRNQGGQLSSMILLGEASAKLHGDGEGKYGKFTNLITEQMKWIELAVKAKEKGGPYLNQFGNDLQSIEALAGILRTEADVTVKKEVFEPLIADIVNTEKANFAKFSNNYA